MHAIRCFCAQEPTGEVIIVIATVVTERWLLELFRIMLCLVRRWTRAHASVPEVFGQFSSIFYMKMDLDSEVDFQNSPLTFLSTSVESEIDNIASSTGILNIDILADMKKLRTMLSLKTPATLTTRSTWLSQRAWTACRLTTSKFFLLFPLVTV